MGTSVSLKNRFAGQLRCSRVELGHMILDLYLWLPRLQHRAGDTQQKQGSTTAAGQRQAKRSPNATQISSVVVNCHTVIEG